MRHAERVEYRAHESRRVGVRADRVAYYMGQVAFRIRRGPRGPYVRLNAHRCAVAAGLRPSLELVAPPRRVLSAELRGSGAGGLAASEPVAQPERELHLGECFDVEAVGADRPTGSQTQLSVVGIATAGQRDGYAGATADPALPRDRLVQRLTPGSPLESRCVCQLADPSQRVPVGCPQSRPCNPCFEPDRSARTAARARRVLVHRLRGL